MPSGRECLPEALGFCRSPESGFQVITLEDCIAAFRAIGDAEAADTLHSRYLDFGKVEKAIFG